MYRKLGFLGKSQEKWENMVRNEEGRVMRTLTATVGTVRVINKCDKMEKSSTHAEVGAVQNLGEQTFD